MYKKNLIPIFFLGLLICFSCNTPKDPAPEIPIFDAADLVGKWKLVAGSANIANGAIKIDDIFDRTNPILQADTTSFCLQNAVLEIFVEGRFQETSNCYQSAPNKTVGGVYTFNQEAAAFLLTYNSDTKITLRKYQITALSSAAMRVNFSDTRQGVVFLSRLFYQKL